MMEAPYSGALADTIYAPGGAERRSHSSLSLAARAVRAFCALGLKEDCERYFAWISDVIDRDAPERLQETYTLDGGRITVPFQLAVHGQAVLAIDEYDRCAGPIPEGLLSKVRDIAEYVCQAWRRPDQDLRDLGIRPEHLVASKVACWAALDRAIGLVARRNLEVPARWPREREILHRTICAQGFDTRQKTFVRAFSDLETDPATLVVAILGFLPIDDPRTVGTLEGGASLVDHQPAKSQEHGPKIDALLLVSALARTNRLEEATKRLEAFASQSHPLGLFTDSLGQYPSTSMHAALIDAALDISEARTRLAGLGSRRAG
jgi:GH15 family glucan-1,4-alpha-glucosidase